MHLFHNWLFGERDERMCRKCGRKESYSAELGGWYDSDYLAGTNYDNMRHAEKEP